MREKMEKISRSAGLKKIVSTGRLPVASLMCSLSLLVLSNKITLHSLLLCIHAPFDLELQTN